MANVMKMAIIEAIQSLRSAGLSCRAIARRLGIHRDTVARHVRVGREGDSKPAKAPISPAGSDEVAGFGAPTGNLPVAQASVAAPWLPWLLEQHARGLTAKRIHQDLQAEFPEAGSVSYDSVRRLLRKQGATLPVPFRRMECAAGHEAQIDFGTGAAVVGPDGKRRRTHVLRVVLSHSRKGYSESVFQQSTDCFLQSLENAFEHFGGVPRTIVVDNLKAAVLQAVSAAEARHAAALADAVQRDAALQSAAYQQQLIELREKGEKEKEKRVQHLSELIARRMLKKDLSRGWTAWHFTWEERVITQRRLQAAASRIKAPELSIAFGFWSSSAAEARRLRDHEALEAARREAMVLTAQQAKAVEVARREAAAEFERHLEQRLALAVQEARVQSRREALHEVQAELQAARESRDEALRLAEVMKDEGSAEAARGEARRQLEAAVEAARAEARREAWAEARAEARQEVWAEMRDAALEAARAEVLVESARAEEARAAVAARALEAARARAAEDAAQERVMELERATTEGLRASNPSASSPTRVPPASAHLYSDEEVRCAKHTALLRRAFESADADRSGGLSKREFYRSLEEVGLRFTASEQLAVWKAFVNGASGLVYARVEWRDYQRVGLALLEQQHAKRRSRRQMADPPDQQKLLRLFTHVAQQNEVRPPVEPTVHLAWAGGAWAGRK